MPALDLEARYGQMVPIGDLARLFYANQRAVRSALERRAVPIFEFGSSTVVPLRLVEQAFGLTALLANEDEVRHQTAARRGCRPRPLRRRRLPKGDRWRVTVIADDGTSATVELRVR